MDQELHERRSKRRFRSVIRSVVIIIALTAIPFMGLRYFSAVTNFLLSGQHNALQLFSRTLSFELNDRVDFETAVPAQLDQFSQVGTRVWLLDKNRRVRQVWGNISSGINNSVLRSLPWYSKLLERPIEWFTRRTIFPRDGVIDYSPKLTHRTESFLDDVLQGEEVKAIRPSLDQSSQILMAANPIWRNDTIYGALLVEQSSESLIAQNRISLISLAAVTLIVFLGLITFILAMAWRLTFRINKLQVATERSISSDGRVLLEHVPPRGSGDDEIGELQNSIANMLERLIEFFST